MGKRLQFVGNFAVIFTLIAGCVLPYTIQAAKIPLQLCRTYDNKQGYCKTQEQCPNAELLDLRTGDCSDDTLYCCPIPKETPMIMTEKYTECDSSKGYCVNSNECAVKTYRTRTNRCPTIEEVCCPNSAFPEATTKKPAVKDILPIDTSTIATSTIAAAISTTPTSNFDNSATSETQAEVKVIEKTTTVAPPTASHTSALDSTSSIPALTSDPTTLATILATPSPAPSASASERTTLSSVRATTSSSSVLLSSQEEIDETQTIQPDQNVDKPEETTDALLQESTPTFTQTTETIPSSTVQTNDMTSNLEDDFSPENFIFQGCGLQNLNGVVNRKLNEEFRAEYGEFPWMVALFQLPEKRYCCNGALIDERMILTTAHCVDRCGGQAANIVARFGEWNMSSNAEMPIPRVEVGVKSFYKHPKYLSSSLINNIALLKLNDAIEYGPTVQPVCLPSPNYTLRGADIIIVTGWGKKMKENSTTTQILKRMDLIRKESSICQEKFRKSGNIKFSLDNSLVCVTTNGEDVERPCDGDAGAPAVVEMPGSNNRFYLHGLVSFGHTCDQKQKRLTMLTKVVDFLDWIDGIMGKNNKGKKYG